MTKKKDGDWAVLREHVETVISQFFAAGLEVMDKNHIEYWESHPAAGAPPTGGAAGAGAAGVSGDMDHDTVVKEIIELIDARVKPFVQSDGGDCDFHELDDKNIVWVKLSGACDGCPSSSVTVKGQIKQLIQHYFPQIIDVNVVGENTFDEIPRPGR